MTLTTEDPKSKGNNGEMDIKHNLAYELFQFFRGLSPTYKSMFMM